MGHVLSLQGHGLSSTQPWSEPGLSGPRPLLDLALVRAGTLGSTAPPRPSPGTRPGKPRSRVGGAVSPTVAGQVHPRMQDTAGAPSPRPGHLGRRSHRDGQPQRPLEGQPQDGDTALAPAWPHTVQQSPLPCPAIRNSQLQPPAPSIVLNMRVYVNAMT